MKKLFSTIALLLTVLTTALAQRYGVPESMLRIRLADGAGVTVEIDGRRYDRISNPLVIGDLPAGRHYIKVYRVSNYSGRRRIPARLIWENRLRLAPGTFTSITLDGWGGGARVRTRPLSSFGNNGSNGNNRNRYEDDNDRDRDGDGWFDYDDRDRFDGDDRDDRDGRRNDYRNDRDGRDYSGSRFSERDMSDLQRRVTDRITDGDKLSTIKTAVGSRALSTAQIGTMMRWLSFESTKVDLARWSYGQVSDPSNFWKLENEFTFQSSKDDLQKIIRSGNGGRGRGRG